MRKVLGSSTRRYLLASTALLAMPQLAHAQTADELTGAYREAQTGAALLSSGKISGEDALLESQSATRTIALPKLNASDALLESYGSKVDVSGVQVDPEILIANPNTPTTARDPVNITGVGQMVVDQGGGFIGLCTGTLINPRTVIFAAHCVNEEPANAYGANSGGTAIGFGFETNTRANAPGQTDELVRWLLGGPNGAGLHQTNVAQSFYNANYVAYNPYSLEPAANGFLYGDVALATLDTPAANIPTWALMFSPLPQPGTINASTGTGYTVNLIGYGNNGTGTSGSSGIDYRRRSAENMLGALTDLQTFEGFLFGGAPNGLTQNLYFLDFDDPRRGMTGASPFDFNAFRDNAVASGKEGITASGDSGGPLVLTNFSKQVVIGVLSGGYTRFFNAQPANGYGTVSFYQPLYLYWDWIAQNNPYHYVASVAGNGSWTDANHWVSTLDPAYNILVGGQVVNGIPTTPGEQKFGTSGDFGQICYQSGGVSDCYDTKTGVETVEAKPIGTAADQPASDAVGVAGNQPAVAQIAGKDGTFDGVTLEKQADGTITAALPPATLANGLPGATGFVPNNSDPVRATSTQGRYFDVTLANTGTTTITSGNNIVIDRLTVGTAGAQLVIDQGASLTTLINTQQFAGFVTVNGTLNTVGDYSLLAGGLLGSGRINAPFLTSVFGQIAPGTTSTIGTLTIGGNLVLSSGNVYMANIGGGTTSDLISVVGRTGTTGEGKANVGGTVMFTPIAGSTVRYNDLYTILTASGGVTGTFNTPSSLSAILRPQFIYNTNSVQARIVAGTYASVVANTPVQTGYARLLDQNRGNYAALSGLYGVLDLQNAATIQSTLESWAPRSESLVYSSAIAGVESNSRLFRGRLAAMDTDTSFDGSLAMVGQPFQLAANNIGMNAVMPGMPMTQSDSSNAMVAPGKLPMGTRGFIAGGYVNGWGRSAPTAIPQGNHDDFDGWYAAAGLEGQVTEDSVLGFGLSYTKLDGTTDAVPQYVKSELALGTLYGKAHWGPATIDSMVTAGWLGSKTQRGAALGGTNYTLRSDNNAFVLASETGLSAQFGDAIKIGPRIAARTSRIEFGKEAETGGPMALFYSRPTRNSAEGLAGLTIGGGTARLRPTASAYYVHEFLDTPLYSSANFVGGVGQYALFATNGRDRDWAEASVGITLDTPRVSFTLGADTTVWRKDVSNQAYRASASIHF